MKNFIKLVSAVCALAVLGACSSDKEDTKLITFNVANRTGVDTGLAYKSVEMPLSGMKLIMNTDVVLYIGDIEQIYAAENTMPTGEKIPGFYFFLSPKGKNKLTNITASNMGAYIVMFYDGKPLGLRVIDAVITDGKLFVCSECAGDMEKMHKIVAEMNESIDDVNEIRSR